MAVIIVLSPGECDAPVYCGGEMFEMSSASLPRESEESCTFSNPALSPSLSCSTIPHFTIIGKTTEIIELVSFTTIVIT